MWSDLEKELEKDDEYVWANVKAVGKSASEVMRDELPKVVESIKFIKTMRWQLNEDNAFSRPMRWLFACHGQSIIPFSALGVTSSDTTRGLRPPGLGSAGGGNADQRPRLLFVFGKEKESFQTSKRAKMKFGVTRYL